MLSGGLDSSAIAVLATRHVPSVDLTAYSVSFGLPTDESVVAGRLAADLGMNHREIRLTRETLAETSTIGFGVWTSRARIPTWTAVSSIARAVREDGIKVLLSVTAATSCSAATAAG